MGDQHRTSTKLILSRCVGRRIEFLTLFILTVFSILNSVQDELKAFARARPEALPACLIGQWPGEHRNSCETAHERHDSRTRGAAGSGGAICLLRAYRATVRRLVLLRFETPKKIFASIVQ